MAEQFKASFTKAHNALAPHPKSLETALKQNPALRASTLLKPKYMCLTCGDTCLSNERKAHADKTGHSFCKDSSNLVERHWTDGTH